MLGPDLLGQTKRSWSFWAHLTMAEEKSWESVYLKSAWHRGCPPRFVDSRGRPSNARTWFPHLPGHQMELLPPASLFRDQLPPSAARAIKRVLEALGRGGGPGGGQEAIRKWRKAAWTPLLIRAAATGEEGWKCFSINELIQQVFIGHLSCALWGRWKTKSSSPSPHSGG